MNRVISSICFHTSPQRTGDGMESIHDKVKSGVGLYEGMKEKLWRLDQLLYLFSPSLNNPSLVFSVCVCVCVCVYVGVCPDITFPL